MTPPTPLESSIDALSAAYGMTAEQVVDLAIHNLTVLAAYQMGAEGADAQRVYGLLLAPAPGVKRQLVEAPSVPQEGPPEPPTWPNPEGPPPPRGGPHYRAVMRAAARMTEPFTSRALAPMTGVTPSVVGGLLGAAGWPSEPHREGQERRWLPRPA